MRRTSYRRTAGVPASREALWPVRAIAASFNPQNRGWVESGRPQLSQVVVAAGRRPERATGRADVSRGGDPAAAQGAPREPGRDLAGEHAPGHSLAGARRGAGGAERRAGGHQLGRRDHGAPGCADPAPPEPTTGVSEGTESALAEWLSAHPSADEVGIADVASAVATSAAGPQGGRMARRLSALGVEPQRLVDALGHTGDQSDLQEFSASVRNLRSMLGSGEVTALEIARALQADHPGYGGGRFEGLDLEPPGETAAASSAPPPHPTSQAPS